MDTIGSPTLAPRAQLQVPNAKSRSCASIERMVASELVPRIASTRRPAARGPRSVTAPFSARDIAYFAELTLLPDDRPVFAFIARALAKPHSVETIYLDLLQPAARRLHALWTKDACDFAAVTLGLCQLHRLLRELSPAFNDVARRCQLSHHALLSPAANEQHSFGLVMVSDFLRREGWLVSSGPFTTRKVLRAAVRSEWFTLVGFSLSCDGGLEALASQISCVRQCSMNRSVSVIVGGRVFIDRPELVARVDADATAPDARQAVMLSRRLATAPNERHA